MIEEQYKKIQALNEIYNAIHSSVILNKDLKDALAPGFSTSIYGKNGNINKIFIIGVGGTGGWFMPKLVKILNDAHAKFLIGKVEVILIDGDTVELKNLARQNFISDDVGKNKAQVICDRYAPHLHSNLSIFYVDKFVANKVVIGKYPKEQQEKFIDINTLMPEQAGTNVGNYLIINFIDNAITRKVIHNRVCELSAQQKFSHIIFDVANNSYNGQISASNYMNNMYDDTSVMMPSNFFLRYPENLNDQEGIKLENCADADINAVSQLFNANDFAASIIANTINAMLQDKCIKYGEITFNTGNNISVTPSLKMTSASPNSNYTINNLFFDMSYKQRSDLAKHLVNKTSIFENIKNNICEKYGNDFINELLKEVKENGYSKCNYLTSDYLKGKFQESFNSFTPQ